MKRPRRPRPPDPASVLARGARSVKITTAERTGRRGIQSIEIGRLTADQLCQIEQLACEAPEKAGRPISQWTNREIADEIVARGIVDRLSPRHAGRLLKKGVSCRT